MMPARRYVLAGGFCRQSWLIMAMMTIVIFDASALAMVECSNFVKLSSNDTKITLDLAGIQCNFSKATFASFPNVTKIEVHGLQLKILPSGTFHGLKRLVDVHIGGGKLFTLPAGIFDGLSDLTTLNLSGNQLDSLTAGVFDPLTSLTTLDLSNNDLRALPAGVFQALGRLESLLLSLNHLSVFPVAIFDALSSLTLLNVDRNRLEDLAEGVFIALRSLQALNLGTNSLMRLPAGLFDTLSSLRLLDLSINPLSNMSARATDHLAQLSVLLLGDTLIEELSINHWSDTNLKIDVSRNSNFWNFTSSSSVPIELLNAQGCHNLKVVEGSLRYLDISGSAVDVSDPAFDCSRAGSQILFAKNMRTKMSSAAALKVTEKCMWTQDRKLLDLTGAWNGDIHRNQLQALLERPMTMFEAGFASLPSFSRTLLLGDASTIQCNQIPTTAKDVVLDLGDGISLSPQDIPVMLFECACVANHDYDDSTDTCKPIVGFLSTPVGTATVVIVTLLTVLLSAIGFRLIRRRVSRLKFNLDVTEHLLGEAQSDVVAMRKAWEISDLEIRFMVRIDGSSPGAFGEVWRADWDGITVAVKVLRLSMMEVDQRTRDEFDKEAGFLMRARHSNVVRFFGAGVQASGAPFLVLELVARGSLRNLLRETETEIAVTTAACEEKHPLSRDVQLQLALDIARGMEYIHELHTLHRDLKSGNVLVTDTWRAKVADFGSMGSILGIQPQRKGGSAVVPWSEETATTRFGNSQTMHSGSDLTLTRGVGTPLYMSPEVLRGDKYGQAADVWSYSVLVWEIVYAKVPDLLKQEGDASGGPLLNRLQRQLERGARLKMGAEAPEWARHVFAEGSTADPQARPSFATIVANLEAAVESK